jgi:hypothetical protein
MAEKLYDYDPADALKSAEAIESNWIRGGRQAPRCLVVMVVGCHGRRAWEVFYGDDR